MAERMTTDEFVARAVQIHGERYHYDKVVYVNAHTNIIIVCPLHGDFEQEPTNHIHLARGCPVCAKGGTADERFWAYVNKNGCQIDYVEGKCWEWVGDLRHNGYGRFWYNGRSLMAHRFSYRIHYGKIPKGMFVLHKCDNPECVNPEHLFLGTIQDNVNDMIEKGRKNVLRGEHNPTAKLTWDEVRSIRKEYATGNYLQREIADMFNVALATVNQIVNYRRWQHE